MPQTDLFGPALPDGMRYELEFLTREEEQALVAHIAALPLDNMRYKGYTARRRVVSYGGKYDYENNVLDDAQAVPEWLYPLREKVAGWAGIDVQQFQHALVAEYRPGTPLGWHRDVLDFEDVVGVSLADVAVMKFRPYPPEGTTRADVIKLDLQPRSVYLLRGPARWAWQHAIAPTQSLRYSITFRTRRARAAGR
ncbi:alpha-ketoglutarate-dependent dioxygenase AlkB [Ramlibacter albus]|uniref:Alpha-ketoglutarate-dependent dioxygenase AlkB n=1 Tax=Ramlibacter albus TaxID=2079448 RepID=A0A923M5N6_9BURK|nr:alpha-ketoglutarate-dependent dioxygenase AlkB [Ramlibacter albus]MBC5763226.1 alpha-ketoglutarate-dependent dioxygenase AlkB [Ramlibacter albus]